MKYKILRIWTFAPYINAGKFEYEVHFKYINTTYSIKFNNFDNIKNVYINE